MPHARTAVLEPFEPRRLFAFATFDPAFGAGGFATIDAAAIDVDATLTPLDDGRLIVAGRSGVWFRRGDGNADRKRGKGGALPLTGRVIDVAVDSATGRIAALRDLGKTGDGRAFAVDLYDARGRLDATRTIADRSSGVPAAIEFDPATGGVFVATDRTLADGPGTVARRAVLWRLDAAMNPDPAFGTQGRATFDYDVGVRGNLGESASFERLLVTAAGAPVLLTRHVDRMSQGELRTQGRMQRLHADGTPQFRYYADGTTLQVLDYFTNWNSALPLEPGTQETVSRLLDASIAGDGRRVMTFLDNAGRYPYDGTINDHRVLSHPGDLINEGFQYSYMTRLEIGAPITGGRLTPRGESVMAYWLNVADGGAPRVYPFTWTTGESGRLDEVPVALDAADFASDRDGRLVGLATATDIAGGRHAVLFALGEEPREDAVAPAVPQGGAILAADGTLQVRGTSDDDLVVVRFDGANVVVELNDRELRFAASGVRALAIAAGRGDDYVELAPGVSSARVLGEAGDDTIVGGDGADTLVGGSGDDVIDGRGGRDLIDGGLGRDVLTGGDGPDTLRGGAGNDELRGGDGDDVLYGGRDKDVLLGGDGADWLAGESGNDRLYASGLVDSVGVDDGAADTLAGDDGLDYIRADAGDRDLFTLDADDTLAYA